MSLLLFEVQFSGLSFKLYVSGLEVTLGVGVWKKGRDAHVG